MSPARRARLAALAAVAALLALAGLAAGAPAGAAPRRAATTTIELADQPAWVKGEAEYAVDVRIAGASPGAAVDMVVHDRLESRGQFRETLDGDLGGTERRIDPQPLASLPSTAPGTVRVGFTPGAAGGLRSSGVYPVEVRVLDAGGEPVATLVTYLSFLRSPTPERPPLDVATIVDIAAPPALQPDGTYVMSPGSIALARQRIDAVARSGGAVLSLAPLPETIEGLVGVGDGESAEVDELGRLTAGRQVVARPFVDVDLAALRDAGLEAEANDQADGGADVVRSRLGVEPAGGVWLSGPTWGAESARRAIALGIGRAVVPPTAVGDGTDDQDVPTGPVHLGDDNGPLAMVSDPDFARHLTSGDGIVAAHRFLAELTITWLEAPSVHRGVVVHLPPTGTLDPTVVGTALAALTDGQAVRSVPITQLFAEVPPPEDGPTTLALAPHSSPDLSPLAPQVRSVRDRVGGVGGLLEDPATAAELEHALLLSTGADTPDGDRQRYLDNADDALRVVSGAVTLPDQFRITLTSRSSSVPVTLTNNLDRDLDVRVELESDQLEFPEGTVVDQTLPPGTTRLEVPVRTRTSGAFTLVVRVTSPDGSLVLDTSTFDVRSTAISGVGLVLSVGAGLFLAVWWARNWRSTRRGRRDDAPGPGPEAGGPDAADAAGAAGAANVPDVPDAARVALRRTGTAHPTPWATASPTPPPGRAVPPPAVGTTGPPPPGAAGPFDGPVPDRPSSATPETPAPPTPSTPAPAAPGAAPWADRGARREVPPGSDPRRGGVSPGPPGWASAPDASPGRRPPTAPAPQDPPPGGAQRDAEGYRPAHMAPSRPGRRLPVPRRGNPGRSR